MGSGHTTWHQKNPNFQSTMFKRSLFPLLFFSLAPSFCYTAGADSQLPEEDSSGVDFLEKIEEYLPRFENPIDLANSRAESEYLTGWDIKDMYNADSTIHKSVQTPYDAIAMLVPGNEPSPMVEKGDQEDAELMKFGTVSLEKMRELMEFKILEDSGLKKPTSELWLQLGNIHRKLGNLRLAILCTRKSYSLNPKSIKSILSMGLILQNNLVKAEKLFEIALAFHPGNAAIAHRMGENLQKQGKHLTALKYFQMAMASERSRPDEDVVHSKMRDNSFQVFTRRIVQCLNNKVAFVTVCVFALVYLGASSSSAGMGGQTDVGCKKKH